METYHKRSIVYVVLYAGLSSVMLSLSLSLSLFLVFGMTLWFFPMWAYLVVQGTKHSWATLKTNTTLAVLILP